MRRCCWSSTPSALTAALILLGALACSGGPSSAPPPAAPAPAPRGEPLPVHGFSADASHRGRVDGELALPLQVRWTAEVGIQGWHNSPIVVGDRVYTSSYGATWNTCDEGDGVVVLDRATGERVAFWPTRCDANGISSNGDTVYTVTDGGEVFAWTLTGEPVFQVSLGENKLYAAPIYALGSLIVSGAHTLVLLNPRTGEVTLRFDVPGTVRQHSVGAHKVYFGSDAGKVGWCSLLDQTCSSFTVPGDGSDNYGAIAIDGDIYAVAGGYDGSSHQDQLAVYGVSDDQKRWGTSHAVGAKAAPAITDELVLFAESGQAGVAGNEAWGGGLYAYDRKTGEERWSYVEAGGSWSSPVVVGDRVVWIPMTGELVVLDLATGARLGSHGLGPVYATPAVVDGVIYVGTDAGELVALGPG